MTNQKDIKTKIAHFDCQISFYNGTCKPYQKNKIKKMRFWHFEVFHWIFWDELAVIF